MSNDTVSGVVKLEIEKKDYEEKVEKNLRQYRQKANIPGFRKGMVPMGLIKKMYGKYVLAEEVNKLVSEYLYNYLRENEIKILGEPLPNETEQQPIDFDVQEDFVFYFDVALAPVIEIKLNKRDKLHRYTIKVDDEMLNNQIETYRKNYGTYEQADEIAETDLVKGTATELSDKKIKEGGIVVEDALLMPQYIKGKREQNKFIGATSNKTIIFNPQKAFKGVAAELASFLKIDKDVASEITADFQFEIKKITRYKEAELNRELFDKIFGENVVETEETFREKVKTVLEEQYQPQCEYMFMIDVRKLLVKKAGDVKFADAILKRWLLTANKETTPEKIEEDYPRVVEDLIYQLTKERIIKDHELKVENAELEEVAKKTVKAQFAQYGMLSVPDDLLAKYTDDMLKNEKSLRGIIDHAIDEKLEKWVNERVKVETREVTQEEFAKLLT